MSEQLAINFGRAPETGIVHVCLPNMSLACEPDFLAKPAGDRVIFGATRHDWPRVTCPWCRCQGRAYLYELGRQMQRRAA